MALQVDLSHSAGTHGLFVVETTELATVSQESRTSLSSPDQALIVPTASLDEWADGRYDYEHANPTFLRLLSLVGSVQDITRAMAYFAGVVAVSGALWLEEILVQEIEDKESDEEWMYYGEDALDSFLVGWNSAAAAFFRDVIAKCPHLRSFTFECSSVVDDSTIAVLSEVLSAHPCLQRINLRWRGCERVVRSLLDSNGQWLQLTRAKPGALTRDCGHGALLTNQLLLASKSRKLLEMSRALNTLASSVRTFADVHVWEQTHAKELGNWVAMSGLSMAHEYEALDAMTKQLSSGYKLWCEAQVCGRAPTRGEDTRRRLRMLGQRWLNDVPDGEKEAWRRLEQYKMKHDKNFVHLLLSAKPRRQFEYVPHSTMVKTRVIGVKSSFEDAQATFPGEYEGNCPPGLTVYQTIGHGPKIFGLTPDGLVWYNHSKEWIVYLTAATVD
mmetsp:Transcript_60192/g.167955  ORF Transcript_60192/g.167955 Transcript_60192/m.167955 type:complete len:443 (-) Transcript_60192:142-1470(-)|eukprot:CAMPEP_0117545988 /NCGR_PEP_ID=MMETSP0784-20121206/46378_1 /TAXON_ID=39447 /ORGANISM="" /LENGTH=442 /DNA_ID=CAMNT_0005342851 /DNA_START=72 /DNA_END=1400 /DNA_ORIENTATION=-